MSDAHSAADAGPASWRDWALGALAMAVAGYGAWDLGSGLLAIFVNNEPVVPLGAVVALMLAASLWRGTVWSSSNPGGVRSGLLRTALFVGLVVGVVLVLPRVLSLLL